MTQRRHITLVSAGATVLAALPLATVFEQWTWLVQVLIVVVAMSGAAVGLRSVRAPGWAPTAGMIAAFLLTLTWLFPSGRELLAVVPTPATVLNWNDLLVQAGVAIRDNGVPVADDKGLLFLAALGLGAVLLAVDLAAVVARRPAIAGVPMVAIYLVAVGTHSESVSFLPFACTAAAFLWLLATDNVDRVRRFGRRFTGDGRDVDVWEPSPLAAAGRRLAVVGVLVAVALPLAIPGMTTGLLDRYGSGVGSGSGPGSGSSRTGQVNLFSFLAGSLVRDRTYEMVKVTTADPSPHYLRFGVAEDITGNGFVNRNWGPGQPLGNLNAPAAPQGAGVASHKYKAQVEILNFSEQMLPVFLQPTKFEKVDSAWQWDRRASVVYSHRANAKGRKYSFDYVRLDFTPEALRTAAALPADNPVQQGFTRVPPVPQVKSIADELTKGKTGPYDKVRAIYDFFTLPANNFRYNLTTKPGNSGSIMVDFLKNREGYCEQYAAAMAWLVRSAGIPARVAFGFTRGNNRNGNTYLLSNFNLHAWTEVYFDRFGWVPFDATPASSVTGTVSTAWAPDPSRPTSAGGPEERDDLPNAGGASGGAEAPQPDLGPNDPDADGAGGNNDGAIPRWPLYTAGGVLAALALLAMPALRRVRLRRKRWPGRGGDDGPAVALTRVGADGAPGDELGAPGAGRADPPEPVQRRARRDAHAAWDELVDTMIDFKVGVDPAETPRVTADRLVRHGSLSGDAAQGAKLLGRAEEHARYAPAPLTGADLAPALRSVRGALRDRVSRRTRLIAALLPPSVITRWRAAAVTNYTGAVNSMSRRRDAVLRRISPRRLLAGRGTR